jgi:hypothetical protein
MITQSQNKTFQSQIVWLGFNRPTKDQLLKLVFLAGAPIKITYKGNVSIELEMATNPDNAKLFVIDSTINNAVKVTRIFSETHSNYMFRTPNNFCNKFGDPISIGKCYEEQIRDLEPLVKASVW